MDREKVESQAPGVGPWLDPTSPTHGARARARVHFSLCASCPHDIRGDPSLRAPRALRIKNRGASSFRAHGSWSGGTIIPATTRHARRTTAASRRASVSSSPVYESDLRCRLRMARNPLHGNRDASGRCSRRSSGKPARGCGHTPGLDSEVQPRPPFDGEIDKTVDRTSPLGRVWTASPRGAVVAACPERWLTRRCRHQRTGDRQATVGAMDGPCGTRADSTVCCTAGGRRSRRRAEGPAWESCPRLVTANQSLSHASAEVHESESTAAISFGVARRCGPLRLDRARQ